MLLRHSLGLETEALAVESAVEATIEAGALTPDLVVTNGRVAQTSEVTAAIVSRIGAEVSATR
jgi:3-isopropylmalate dehydrogenase